MSVWLKFVLSGLVSFVLYWFLYPISFRLDRFYFNRFHLTLAGIYWFYCWARVWMIGGGSSPGTGWEFFYSLSRPDWLLSNGEQGLFLWG